MTDRPRSIQYPPVVIEAFHTAEPAEPVKARTFQDIFASELRYVWHSLRRLGIPDRDLEDLTHDVFFSVYERFTAYDAARPVKPWLFGFAFRVASDYRRKSSNRREVLGGELEARDASPTALDRLEHAEALGLARVALDSIELEKRAVFILHEIDGCAVPEIASALGVPLNTAYSRLRAARDQFQAALRRERLRRGEP